MQAVFEWLSALPPFALYAALALTAAIENFFPPFPADTVVAFGSFLAARGQASLIGSFVSTWFGNVAGAMAVYAMGRRYGAKRLAARFGSEVAQQRVHALYGKYGVTALALSRFLPGVRALVAPVAGALRIPAWEAALAIGAASAIWYGAITFLAYRVGSDWEALQRAMGEAARWIAIAAAVLTAVGVGVWLLWRRRPA